MKLNEIRNKLNSNEYKFLKDEAVLGDNLMLLTLGGSFAYGTNIQTEAHTSDLDLRGIRIDTPREILSMNLADKPYENKELDVVIHPFNHMVELLTKCNPNCIELLGTKDEHIFHLSEEGKLLRDNADLFLSQKAFYSFGGYATAQLRRLENALARGEYPQEEKERHILKSLEQKLFSIEDNYTKLTNQSLKLYLDNSDKEGFDKEVFMDIELTHYPLRDFKCIYSGLSSVVRDFDKLGNRNSKKDETHLLKHAMHLVRLLKMGTEILEGKGISTYREKDKDLLLSIREGKLSYEDIFELTNELEKDFLYAHKNTSLSKEVDRKGIEELRIEINQSVLKKICK